MTHNQILYWQNVETNRSNLAREKETNRANLARERETNRSNLAQEKETNRHNLAVEKETNRSNVQREILTTLQRQQDFRIHLDSQQFKYAQLAEQKRANVSQEQLRDMEIRLNNEIQRQRNLISQQSQRLEYQSRAQSLTETTRSNKAQEALSAQRNVETARSNLANEALREAANVINAQQLTLDQGRLAEQARHNTVVEQETHRANLTRESIDRINATASVMSGAGNLMRGVSSVAPNLSGTLSNAISSGRRRFALWQIRK